MTQDMTSTFLFSEISLAPIRRLLILSLAFLTAACQTPQQQPRLPTLSGNPEIVVPNVSRRAVIDKIVAAKLELGMQLRSASDFEVAFRANFDPGFVFSLLNSSPIGTKPEVRLVYSIVEVLGGVRVFSRAEVITNPGSTLERVTDVTHRLAAQMQAELAELRAGFGG